MKRTCMMCVSGLVCVGFGLETKTCEIIYIPINEWYVSEDSSDGRKTVVSMRCDENPRQ